MCVAWAETIGLELTTLAKVILSVHLLVFESSLTIKSSSKVFEEAKAPCSLFIESEILRSSWHNTSPFDSSCKAKDTIHFLGQSSSMYKTSSALHGSVTDLSMRVLSKSKSDSGPVNAEMGHPTNICSREFALSSSLTI